MDEIGVVGRIKENARQHRAIVRAIALLVSYILNLLAKPFARLNFRKRLRLQVAHGAQHFA